MNFGFLEGYSNYHGLETSFTKRFSHRWQASGTYTFSGFCDGTPPPPAIAMVDGELTRTRALVSTVAKDVAASTGLAAERPAPSRGVQRHLGRPATASR